MLFTDLKNHVGMGYAAIGPWHTLITHLPLKYHVLTGRRMYYVHALHASHGPIVRISPREVAVADPAGFTAIHRIGSGFLKAPWYEESNSPDGGEPSIFAMRDPRKHATRRRLLGRVFTKASLRKEWEGVVRNKVDVAVSKIRKEAEGDGCSDVLKWFTMLATDVVAHLCFGESFKMLELGEKNDYMKMLELISVQNITRYELPWLHFIRSHVPLLKSSTDLVDAQAVLDSYGDRAVENLRQNSDRNRTLFATLLNALDADDTNDKEEKEQDGNAKLTEEMVQRESRSMIIGGSDTTSITLAYLVWVVVKRPDLRVRMEDEVAGLSPDFDDDALEKLPLLNAVIDETLRLYGAVPGQLSRSVPAGGATIGAYFVPGGVTVETQAYTLHRDPEVWPDPLRFDETRFMDQSRLTANQKLLYSPWGAGSRICLGVELARMELRLAVAVLFRECRDLRMAPVMTDEMMEMENFFMISPVGHKCEVTLS
ncbi:TRI11 protein [Colletotrichum simmondsii]|uniref:TRI11 protein n=1 Tax=Colletotrichum simmondsii TaxID=703756 RepID=A0A135SCH2_9PEZI|nr:TRI11 protein [Colletotrichum simmondsii]